MGEAKAIPDEAWEIGPSEAVTAVGPANLPGLPLGHNDDLWRDTFTADAFDGKAVPARAWHVPGIIPGRTVTLQSGDGGTGKSTLALQLAVATVAETPWLGQQARGGRVLYLSAEDDTDEVHRRLDAITLHYQIGFERLAGLRVWDLANVDALLATGAPGKPLEPTALWSDVQGVARAWRPSLIVLDSSADVFGGGENERAQVRRFVGMLRHLALETDAAVVLLSHPSLTGMASGSGLSGSTAWNNSVRSRLYFTAPRDEDGTTNSPDIRSLSLRKSNYGPSGVEYRLRYCAGAFVNEDVGTEPAIDKQVAADRIERQFLDLLAAFEAQGRIVSDSTGRNFAPHLFAADPGAKGTTKRGFEQAMSRLFASRQIRIAMVGRASHARRAIVREPS
jgi:RecA-family ATPase